MQYIDNDMDELFEKAGRDYPLKTDNPGWDAVFDKLQQPDTTPTAPNPRPANKKYYWLLLLLLLPIGYIVFDSIPGNNENNRQKTSQNKNNGTENNQKINTPVKSSIDIVERERGNHVRGLYPVSRWRDKPGDSKDFTHSAAERFERNEVSPQDGGGYSSLPHFSINYSYEKPFINIPVTASSSQPQAQPKLKTPSRLYAGLIAGPDLSTIKYQQINNAGYSVGILAGYNISRKLSIETGLFYSKKKYYTDGKYFDKTKANISPNVYVENLNGGCEMFEIPISMRYNFRTKPNTLFATAGFTSYFMKNEDYDYKAYAGGSYYEGYRSYKNSGNHFFANMQLSFGYNYQLSPKINLRAEPYIKIPVNKIGIGHMPITSAGIYFGILKNIK